MSELAIAAAMATTPTTTASFAAPLWVHLLLLLLRCSSAVSRLRRFGLLSLRLPGLLRTRASAKEGAQHAVRAPPAAVRLPRGLLAAWVGVDATAPGRDRGRDWQAEAALRDCVRSAPTPRGHCASPSGSGSEFRGTPRPVPRGGGQRREAGGGSERGRETGREPGRPEGGGRRQRAGERALALAPPSLPLVLATSRRDNREKLAHASLPTGIKQVMASHLRCCCCSGRGTVAAQEFSRRRHPPEQRDSLLAAPSRGGPSLPELSRSARSRRPPLPPPPPKSPAGRAG